MHFGRDAAPHGTPSHLIVRIGSTSHPTALPVMVWLIMAHLQHRVVMVTGGAGGIGRAIVRQCLDEGARVGVLDRQLPRDELRDDDNLLSLAGDVSQEPFVRDAVVQVVDHWGRLDGLVNNAGIMRDAAIEEQTLDDWRTLLDINVGGMMLTAKHAFPHLKKRGGAIVNCASIMAYTSAPASVAYTTSKSAILGLTRAMAMDGAPHRVRCNVVCPGTIDTPMYRRYLDSQADPDALHARFNAMMPLGRIGTPEDVAPLVTFLLSDQASYITGAQFVIDGGFMIRGTNQ